MPAPGAARELRRSAPFLRPLLMGGAYVAVADEASTIFYNPAGLAGIPEASVEALTLQLYLDDTLRTALIDPDKVEAEYQDLTQQDFRDLLGTTLFAQVNLRTPVIAVPQRGFAIGLLVDALMFVEVLQNPVLPGLRLEFYLDETFFFTLAYQWGDYVSFGFTPKLINRWGIDKTFSFGELFVAGSTLDLESQPEYQELQDGKTRAVLGLDMGLLFRFPFWPEWHPRLGVSVLNIGGYEPGDGLRGMEFGPRPGPFEPPAAGELPLLNTVGVAVSPVWNLIRFTLALDVVDVTRTALPGRDWAKRSRLGVEIGFFSHGDGTALFSLLAGLNATHRSVGILSRIWIFEIGFGTYRVELGAEAGDRPHDRNVFIFGFRF